MSMIILIAQIILSVLLVGAVLLQSSSGGLGQSLGGSGTYHTKRGMEKALFSATIVLSVLFVITSIVSLLPIA